MWERAKKRSRVRVNDPILERVPLYDFECERCGRRIEVLQKYDDPAPVDDEPCAANDVIVGGDTLVGADDPRAQELCRFARMPSTILQRWRGDYGNEGRGGWTRQGDVMIRASKGKSGEDRR